MHGQKVHYVVIVGAGTMGHGIAQVFATYGFAVRLLDSNQETVNLALCKIRDSLCKLESKNKLPEGQNAASVLSRIEIIQSLSLVDNADLVIEAITEHRTTKLTLFKELCLHTKSDAILASNTSSIALTELAAQCTHPERVIGMHFMNPVPLMPLIEVIRAEQSSEQTHHTIVQLCDILDKKAISVHDAPGFIANRILMPMINEAIFALYEGVASAEAIDDIMKLGMGHPMGPLRLADLIGLDTCLSIIDVLYHSFRDSKYRACPLLVRKVAAGELGQKTGKGFYTYS